MGELALASGDLEGARRVLQPLVEKNGKLGRAQMLMGHVDSLSGRAEAAIARYRVVVDLEPDNAEALNNLASLLTGRAVDEALRLAQRAKELAPGDPSVADTLGWVLYQKGLYAAAVQQLETASKGPNPVAKYHLAMAYTRSGNRDGAERELAMARKIAPAMAEAVQAEALLRGRPLER
jgi:cellulose synthase operon protein C